MKPVVKLNELTEINGTVSFEYEVVIWLRPENQTWQWKCQKLGTYGGGYNTKAEAVEALELAVMRGRE